MPRKPIIGLVIIGVVALLTYSIVGAVGAQVMGGKGEWSAWRGSHILIFVGIWVGSIVVIATPLLWVVGRRLEKAMSDQEQSVAAAAGVGRFAMKALQGDVASTDKLFELLEDQSLPVRCQAARGLALLDKREVDKELFRQVRYWKADDKVALVNSLRSTRDFRTRRLMAILANDRNPIVHRRARSAMVHVTPRTSRVDTMAASVKESQTGAAGESAGLGERSFGQRRSAGVRPKEAPTGVAKAGGVSGPSMAPGDRAARAAERGTASGKRRAAKAAEKADHQPPMRSKRLRAPGEARPAEPGAAPAKPKRPAADGAEPAKRKRPAGEGAAPAKTKRPGAEVAAAATPKRPAGPDGKPKSSAARPAATKPPAARPAAPSAARSPAPSAARPAASKPAARPAGPDGKPKPPAARPGASGPAQQPERAHTAPASSDAAEGQQEAAEPRPAGTVEDDTGA